MRSLLRIVSFTRHLWPYYLAVSLLSIAVALLAQTVPLLIGQIVGQLEGISSGNVDERLLWIFVFLLFGQDLLTSVVSNIQGYLGDVLAGKIQRDLSDRYYEHLMSLPQTYFDEELTGSITSRLNRGIVQLSQFANIMANNFSSFLLSAMISLIIVAFISWPVALLLFTLYPIFIYLTVRTSGKWTVFQKKKNTNQDIAFGRFQEVIGQIKVVKSFVRERSEMGYFGRHVNKVLQLTYPQSKLWHSRDVQRLSILNVVMGLTFAVIIYQAINEQISLTEAVMLIQFSSLVRFPIFTISYLVENVQRAVADSRDYFGVMEIQPAITDRDGAKKLNVQKGSVAFDSVGFSYGDKKVFKDLTFTIDSGTKVALVGESGEGKTTISNLLIRLYEADAGTITIDGQDVRDVTQKSLRQSIGMVFQDASLFSGTIKENIMYGAPKATLKQVKAAAKAANADEFIGKFSDRYDTKIGERGLKLSGGQKQRIAIARAILKDAPILVLDEATSSLDNKSELLVQEALERLMANRTTIIIAHRLSTIQNVDTIIALQDGLVDEVGPPAKLAKSGGIYSRLLEVQSANSPEARKKGTAEIRYCRVEATVI